MAKTVYVHTPLAESDYGTLTLKLYPGVGAGQSDTIANGAGGDELTEESNSIGDYSCSVAESITGIHRGTVTDASGHLLAKVYVDMDEAAPVAESTYIHPVYHADIRLTIDEANTQDEYTATWFKNGIRVTSGITSPTIQVARRSNGTDLIASTAMTQIGSTGSYKFDEASARTTAGESALVVVTATIAGSVRTFAALVSRDSTA